MVARVLDEGSDVNEAMMLEGVYGSQYPETGKPLHRDYQLLAPLADRAAAIGTRSLQAVTRQRTGPVSSGLPTGRLPLERVRPVGRQLFKSERLRLLLCIHGAVAEDVPGRAGASHGPAIDGRRRSGGRGTEDFDRAIEAAKANQLLYQLNYDDDYDWTDGLCERDRRLGVATRSVHRRSKRGHEVGAGVEVRSAG